MTRQSAEAILKSLVVFIYGAMHYITVDFVKLCYK